MASYHLSTDIVKRSLGYSAVAASAYANGIDFYNERVNKLEAYGRKRGVFHSEILAPENAPDWIFNRHELWNRVERFEKRYDAQVARTMVLALPHELPDEDKIALVNEFARDMFVSQGFVVDAGFHRADRRGDQRNDHAHLVISMRPVEGDDFAKKKPRDFMGKEEKLEFWRERWAFYQNKALEEAGFDTQVDHRTLEAQGLDHAPTVHMGRKAMLLERRGEQSELGDKNRYIEEHNHQIDTIINELAGLDAEIAQELEEEFTVSPEPEGVPALTWEEQKASIDLFNSPMACAYEKNIKEHGEIKEKGLGKRWFDRTLTMFENIYYNIKDYVGTAFERLVGGNEDPEADQDREPGDYEPGG